MSAAVYSQLMTKMGLYSIVWGCVHSKYRLGTHKQLFVDVYTICHYIHYVSVNAKYHIENTLENNQTICLYAIISATKIMLGLSTAYFFSFHIDAEVKVNR